MLLRLESRGGMVHMYGLAASQLRRLKSAGIRLTASVDEVAASGGYMMACVAERIIAAPFAIIGSIGVVGQLPNFNRFLKEHSVDFELHTAGQYKRTLTLFGENTDAARHKFQEELEDTHKLFKSFVTENRPQLEIEMVATGEHWYGTRALERKRRLPARRQQGPRHLRGALQTPSSFAGTAGIRHSRRGQGCERRALAGPDVTLAIPTHPRVPPIPGDGLLGPDLDLPGVAANLAVLHQAAFHVGLQEEFNGFTAIGAGDLEAVVHVL